MKDVISCIKKYIRVTEEAQFVIHWKELAARLLNGINNKYQQKFREPSIVSIIEEIINNIDQFETKDRSFKISTNSIFVHGIKSQVEFEYYGTKTQRELGDIVFVLSIVYKGRKFFEKMTINQVKKQKSTTATTVSWSFGNESCREQLYLLSRFPTFRGVKGSLIPMKEYNLANTSWCLGSHGLLYHPGDFALVSSKGLEVILSGRKSLKLEDLAGGFPPYTTDSCFPSCLLYGYDLDLEECFYILLGLPRFYPCFYPLSFTCNLPILGSRCISYNAYDFSDKYLVGLVGELIYAKNLPYNKPAFQLLQDLLGAIRGRAEREHLKNLLSFISSFYRYKYEGQEGEGEGYGELNNELDNEGGGVGIVHTIVDLGEGE